MSFEFIPLAMTGFGTIGRFGSEVEGFDGCTKYSDEKGTDQLEIDPGMDEEES